MILDKNYEKIYGQEVDINNPEIRYISNELTEEIRAELARSCNIFLCPSINTF